MIKSKTKRVDKSGAAFDKMAIAIGEYIKTMGGTAVVVGGVSIGQEIGSLRHNYFIKVGITGSIPTKTNL